jgi:hypothetical protein
MIQRTRFINPFNETLKKKRPSHATLRPHIIRLFRLYAVKNRGATRQEDFPSTLKSVRSPPTSWLMR